MLMLSCTVWAKNSLLITVVDEVFSLVKISGKLYKSCMCLILSQSRRCLYIALSLSVSACSCVRNEPMMIVTNPGRCNVMNKGCTRTKSYLFYQKNLSLCRFC